MVPTGRDAGIGFAVGWFLLALGAGALIPRPGRGIYTLIAESPCPVCWRSSLLICGPLLIVSSFTPFRRLRLVAAVLGLVNWLAISFLFVNAQLWGATIQAFAAIVLLNGCIFHSLRKKR